MKRNFYKIFSVFLIVLSLLYMTDLTRYVVWGSSPVLGHGFLPDDDDVDPTRPGDPDPGFPPRPGDPTPDPTKVPTPDPTQIPTPDPTQVPTPDPTQIPTPEPTKPPTPEPTIAPTPEPTIAPTPEPTVAPTPEPTVAPDPEPTAAPTKAPTPEPTASPTSVPTKTPTSVPTPIVIATPIVENPEEPDDFDDNGEEDAVVTNPIVDVTPTVAPTDVPTVAPTDVPTKTPTDVPEAKKTDVPDKKPSPTPEAESTDDVLSPDPEESDDNTAEENGKDAENDIPADDGNIDRKGDPSGTLNVSKTETFTEKQAKTAGVNGRDSVIARKLSAIILAKSPLEALLKGLVPIGLMLLLLIRNNMIWYGALGGEDTGSFIRTRQKDKNKSIAGIQSIIDEYCDNGRSVEELQNALRKSRVRSVVPIGCRMKMTITTPLGVEESPVYGAKEERLYDILKDYEDTDCTVEVRLFTGKSQEEFKLSFRFGDKSWNENGLFDNKPAVIDFDSI